MYEDIQQKRLTDESTEPYQVRLWKFGGNHQAVAVEIHGAAVPGPISRSRHRQTFGIILEDLNPSVSGSEFRLLKRDIAG